MATSTEFKESKRYALRRARITYGTVVFGIDPAKRGERITKLVVYHYGPSGTDQLANDTKIYIDSVHVFWDGNRNNNYSDRKGKYSSTAPIPASWDVPANERITQVKLYFVSGSYIEPIVAGIIFVTDAGTESPTFGTTTAFSRASSEVIEFAGYQLIDFSGVAPVDSSIHSLSFVFSPVSPAIVQPPQPSTTAPPRPSTTAPPRPSTTAPPKPSTTAPPQPSTTAPPRPSTTAPPQPPTTAFKPGDKVEVLINGKWVPGEYKSDLSPFSNMKATPHNVAYDTGATSGRKNVGHNEIRPWTGTIKSPLEPPKNPADVKLAELESAVIKEVNEMRANPRAYAKKLANLKNLYAEVDGQWYVNVPDEGATFIGTSAQKQDYEAWLDETIKELENCKPLPILKPNTKLRQGADYFASDSGNVNGPKHQDSQGRGAQERAKLAGYSGGVNECIPADQRTAFGTVSQLLIDWRVQSRGHRKNLMAENTKEIGVASHYFPDYIRTVIQCGYG